MFGHELGRRLPSNTSWLLFDKVSRMGLGLIVVVWIARIVGPAEFGVFNYATALVSMVSALSALGLQGILTRDLVRTPAARAELLASALALRLVASLAGVVVAMVAIWVLRPGDQLAAVLVLILALSALPQCADIIEYECQSRLQAKPIVVLRNCAFFSFVLVKSGLALWGAGIVLFAASNTAEIVMAGALMAWYAHSRGIPLSLAHASWSACRNLLRDCLPVVISSVAILIYMRIDQLMLGQMLGDEAVGMYSAAARVSEAWYFVPVSIMVSVAPLLTKWHQEGTAVYAKRLRQLMTGMLWLGIAVAALLTWGGHSLVHLLYGNAYSPASTVLIVHAWTGPFVALGLVTGSWFLNNGLLRYSMFQTLIGATANIALNLLMIPRWGAAGAALATVVSQAISTTIVNGLIPACRPVFMMQVRCVFGR